MKRLFYMMHVPWGWIKQRPHFIAEGLAPHFDLKIVFDRVNESDKNMFVANNSNLHITTFPSIRFVNSFFNTRTAGRINYYIKKIYCIYQQLLSDVVWITTPSQFAHIQHFLPKGKKVVYDNMDDMPAFYKNSSSLLEIEKKLCLRADVIFCSAVSLKEKLCVRYGVSAEKITVVNNAVNLPAKQADVDIPKTVDELFDKKRTNVIYIGTVASWIDFPLLLAALEEINDLNMILIGPLDTDIPSHPRLKYHLPIEHHFVFPVMAKADILMMPFVLNDIILSVNPVKAYEYIYSGKPTLLVRYPETEKFANFCHLYSSEQQFLAILSTLRFNPSNIDRDLIDSFIANNTWENRIEEVLHHI